MVELKIAGNTCIEFSPEELQKVLQCLMDLPYREANPIIGSIINQLAQQQSENNNEVGR